MPIDFTPLRKVLELEHRKDYSDSVVFGGLDRFLAKWGARVEGAITDSALLKRFNKLRKINYASLNKQQRQQQIKHMLNFISDAEQVTPHKNKTKPTISLTETYNPSIKKLKQMTNIKLKHVLPKNTTKTTKNTHSVRKKYYHCTTVYQ